ncbi:MAG TPA: thioredoxin domain-containing protein [Polyangiaceae bacterium]
MVSSRIPQFRYWLFSLIAVQASCGGTVAPAASNVSATRTTVAPAVIVQPSEQIPVYVEDLSVGNPGAAVTIVAFLDVECPYCATAWATLERLNAKFRPEELRIVIKHLPLPFHKHATDAARAVLSAQREGGQAVALSLLRTLFGRQTELTDSNIRSWAQSDHTPTGPALAVSITPDEQLQRDALLAHRLGIDGTPTFLINGTTSVGAMPESDFERIIANELLAAKQLLAGGVPAGEVYARRVRENFRPEQPHEATPPSEPTDSTRWAIPIGSSPTLGPVTAPIVIVAFMDYECPFCQRGFSILKQLRDKYPDAVRVAWKHRPLDFHKHAALASQVAIEAREQKGDAGFWAATEQLFANQSSIAGDDSSETLTRLSRDLGIDQANWQKHTALRERVLTDDGDLADDFGVEGTPHFFVNGVHVKGAQPVEAFSTLIDSELARAEAQRGSGVAAHQLYTALTVDAQPAPLPPRIDETVNLPEGPTLGLRQAPLTIHVFSDYQCPFCQRGDATVRGILTKYPKQVRLVWHDLPLAFHDRARPAATLAREVRAHKGDAGFFEVNRLLFQNQADLTEPALLRYAQSLGVDASTLEASRREAAHGPAVDQDRKLATQLKITSTPTFIVGRYLVEGAQPAQKFERLIRRELAHPKAKPRPMAQR